MTIALPTHFVDAVGSAASTGMEMAGSVLHDVAQAAETASEATSGQVQRLLRAVRQQLPAARRRTGRRHLLMVIALSVTVVAIVARRRSRKSMRIADMEIDGIRTKQPAPATNDIYAAGRGSARPDRADVSDNTGVAKDKIDAT
jgi:hypothetical protein